MKPPDTLLASLITDMPGWLSSHLTETGWLLGLRVLGSLLIFFTGIWFSRWFARWLRQILDHAGVQQIVASFTTNLLKAVFIVLILVAAVANLGFPITPVLAVLGAAGLAVGLALQGTLSNLASGVLLAILRPFNVGDFIEIPGHAGTVEAVHIFQTRLVTLDHRVVILPNSLLTNQPLVNCTTKGTRRLDLVIDIAYDEDLPRVKDTLLQIVTANKRVLAHPAPVIGVLALAAHSVQIAVRPWVAAGDIVPAQFELLEAIKLRFDAEGVEIPFPQRVVHHVGKPPSPKTP
ncbi:MAG: mechanosensitive ion channel [Candidatus Methylacidiphilales bacterium]|nr:mechanosensitive ion channel [Candidatus Methylacidiphilales bacterium]